jgi:nitroimidazol reductase NimA-like FMN-containing flavoprotein (pyridoxamine 5'-phosphate oxidase superfamily)
MGVAKELALIDAQIEEILCNQWVARIATLGPGQRINLVPMWFGWAGGLIYMYARGQKVINLRRNAVCTVLVDRHEKYSELQGIMMLGRGRVLEDLAAEQADPYLEEIRAQFGKKYQGGDGNPRTSTPRLAVATAAGSTRRWIVFTPDRIVTWDNTKLGAVRGK